ncbi:hypothetical protein CAL7716_043710 [Calothrix sp. PCC 7716]|nr:hypothetical protein CAL7716_043710 [Calothrix sp. PCC 7716]
MIKRLVDYDNANKFIPFLWNYKFDKPEKQLIESLTDSISNAYKSKNIWLSMWLTDEELNQIIEALEKVSDKEISMLNSVTKGSYIKFLSELKGKAM